MKIKLSIIAILLGTGGALAAASGHAAERGFYVGASAGYSAINTPSGSAFSVDQSTNATLYTQTSSTNETGGFGGSLFAGYNINKTFAVELGYTTYAESTYKSDQSKYTATVPGSGNWSYNSSNSSSITYNTNSIDLFLKGTVPVIARVDAFAKVGLSYVSQSVDYSNPAGVPTISVDNGTFATPDSGVNTYTAIRPAGALGLNYQATDHVSTSFFVQGFMGQGDFATENDAIASAYIVGASVSYAF